MSVWIHSTSKANALSILERGFNLPKESGRFGKGIYFGSIDYDYIVPNGISLTADINSPVLSLSHKEICNIFNDYNLEPEEEGISLLEEYTKLLGYLAVEVKYADSSSELVVYDTSAIKNIRLFKS